MACIFRVLCMAMCHDDLLLLVLLNLKITGFCMNPTEKKVRQINTMQCSGDADGLRLVLAWILTVL